MGKVKVFGKGFLGSAGDYNGSKFGNRCQTGMTLRDYFAAKAMQAMMVRGDEYKNAHARKLMSEMAYAIADAMIAAMKGDK